MESNRDACETLWKLVEDCRFAMLVTVEGDGALRSRPMTTVQKAFDGSLWFFSPAAAAAVTAIALNTEVCVIYTDAKGADFVSLSGNGSIESDVEHKQKLWNPLMQAWFPQGPAACDVVLIRVDVNHAEYWDSNSNTLAQLYSTTSVWVKGSLPQHSGAHRSISM